MVAVRLVNGNGPHEGRVEVYSNGLWGTICGYEWRIQEASVICRQLGYPSASKAWRGAHFGRSTGPILLGDIYCDGDEPSIAFCDHHGWFKHDCNQNNEVGVTCSNVTSEPGE